MRCAAARYAAAVSSGEAAGAAGYTREIQRFLTGCAMAGARGDVAAHDGALFPFGMAARRGAA